ncbi:MAG: selenium metabolism-associated LysR family transcriptional regulator [Syntrophales bacterium]|nr:selenium metabolism-associated LysR family transcriptional regulator [Syntrophales bacterium]
MVVKFSMSYDQFKNITIQQMESLVHIVEEGSFSRAAKKVFLTQPSLTKHIKNLEESIDARIVNRRNRGIFLTPEGKILYDYAKKILRLRDEAKEKISRMKENESGSIFIRASTIPATYILPRLLNDFKELFPDIRAYVQTSDSEETLEMILDDQAEMGFIGKQTFDKRLNVESLWRDNLILAVPADHLWVKKKYVTLDEVSKAPFVIRERGSATREILEDYLRKNTDRSLLSMFNIVCEMGSSEAVKEAIIAGLGVSILSVHAIKRELQQGVLCEVPIQDCTIQRHIYLIYKKQFSLMHYHKLFLEFVKNYEA